MTYPASGEIGPPGPARNNNRIIKWALISAAVLFMCFVGLLSLTLAFLGSGGAFLVGIVIALLPLPLYLALALWIDRYEKEPVWMLAIAFLWGATIAVFVSGIINSLSAAVVGAYLGPETGRLFALGVSAPIIEESTKALALFILFFIKKDEFDGVMDGIVYAAMVGLGFATVENFSYYARAFMEGGASGSLVSFIVRGVIDPFGHPVDTAMTGIGLGLAQRSRSMLVKVVAPITGLAVAIILHSIFNLSSALLGIGALLIDVVLLMAVLTVVFFALRHEGQIVRYYLTPELQNGLLSRQEYDALGSVFGRIAASLRALSRGGFRRWRAYSRFSQTATELAFHRDRVNRGIISTDDAGREATYVRILQGMRGG